MGNEKSSPSGLKIAEIIKISDDWTQKSATLTNNKTKICVFEQYLKEDNVQNLKNFSKNLKLYRHPNILKYISSWRTNKTLYVATEFGQPLSLVIKDLTPMEICIGLFGILKAITFLQEMASSFHNNISKDAVYVTTDGSWKLGKLELMTRKKLSEMDCDSSEFADQKGFAVLANEVLQSVTDDDIPTVEEFKQFCRSHVVSSVPNSQFFKQIFCHSFFTHRFLNIYNFLYDLPIKNEAEKAVFFETLTDDLKMYPEEMVASQLGNLLLSRLVALNSTAEKFLLPRIFTPKTEENTSLFSLPVLQKYIAPRLLNMFLVRDSQIRLLLLRHFKSFHVVFTREQLQTVILPELLVGIKDVNETLVADTLHTLADLVPLLGASTVIGKSRAKLFADGRPFVLIKKEECQNRTSITSDLTSEHSPLNASSFSLPERLSPDGGEDLQEIILAHDGNLSSSEKLDTQDMTFKNDTANKSALETLKLSFPSTKNSLTADVFNIETHAPSNREKNHQSSRQVEEDLSTLDVKCSRSKHDTQFDDIELMFKDMEPIISRTAVMKIPDTNETAKNKFTVTEVGDDFEGWGDEIHGEWVGSDTED